MLIIIETYICRRKNKLMKVFFELPRHLIISVICGSIEFLGFYILYQALPLGVAYVIPFCAATCFGYFGHNYFTFRKNEVSFQNASKFLLQILFVMGFGYIVLMTLISIGLNPMLSKAFQLFVGFGFNFSIGKYITFR